MRPKAPGLFISKWREEGPVSLEVAEQWRNDFGWEDWMAIIEAALTSMLLSSSTSLRQNSHCTKGDL